VGVTSDVVVPSTRLFADRRRGVDRRGGPRRASIQEVESERRLVVDRRRGGERRSTLERRSRAGRQVLAESPSEHLRNALQLLRQVRDSGELGSESRADLTAGLDRLERALRLLEPRSRSW
jgi:hypothetical protein